MTKTLLTLGHGFCAGYLADRLLSEGWRVIGTTRTDAGAARLRSRGVEPCLWGRDDLREPVRAATHILCSAAPQDGKDPILPALSAALPNAQAEWIGYLSTVGVYGDHGGAWVDEDTATPGSTARASARLKAETAWQALTPAAHIFRLGGIYGPSRGPLEKLRGGKVQMVIKPGQVFSRIHVDDVVGAVMASFAGPNPGRIYNLVDNEPAPPQDVLAAAAQLLGVPVPPGTPFDNAQMSPLARAFYSDNKRVRNDRLSNELAYSLRYPGYEKGLKACLAAERAE